MTDAKRDQNFVPTILAALNAAGTGVLPVKADPSNHALQIDDDTTGSDHGQTQALRDQNDVHSIMAVSEVDGVTPVVLYADSNGKLLIDSN
jgi:hypothetical protein